MKLFMQQQKKNKLKTKGNQKQLQMNNNCWIIFSRLRIIEGSASSKERRTQIYNLSNQIQMYWNLCKIPN